MGSREDILKQLYKILSKNYSEGKLYQNSAENCKRLLFKNFFRKLSHQKRSFCRRIKYEIQVLENEIELLGGEPVVKREDWKTSGDKILPVFRAEKDGLIKECYRRERENIAIYNSLLSRICVGQIREMLLFQKHSVQLILNEIESMGLKVYEEKNGSEKQYK